MVQVLREPARKGALLDLLLVSGEGLVGEVMIGGYLDHGDHEVVKFKIFCHRNFNPGFGRADLRLLMELVSKVPWETAFKDIGVQQCWSVFKHHLLRAWEQAIPKCWKSRRRGRRLGA